MPQTHDWHYRGRDRFWHFLWLRVMTPPVHHAVTNEIDPPYRRSRTTVVHLWPTKMGLAFGVWETVERTEDEALREAIRLP